MRDQYTMKRQGHPPTPTHQATSSGRLFTITPSISWRHALSLTDLSLRNDAFFERYIAFVDIVSLSWFLGVVYRASIVVLHIRSTKVSDMLKSRLVCRRPFITRSFLANAILVGPLP